MQRYGVVLQELRLEVLRNNAYLASVSTPQAGGVSTEEDGGHGGFGYLGGGNQTGEDILPTSVDALEGGLAQMASWDQFDSLVSLHFCMLNIASATTNREANNERSPVVQLL